MKSFIIILADPADVVFPLKKKTKKIGHPYHSEVLKIYVDQISDLLDMLTKLHKNRSSRVVVV